MTNISPWSSQSSAYSPPYICRARVEKIDDPRNRNRVAVRLFGLQDNQGNIPKDQLEWVHCMSHDSQIPGATSTHNYYPGAEVMVMDTGTEKFIIGSVPGFDGEKRLSQNPWGVDTSQNQNADVPNVNRQQPSDTTTRNQSGSIVGPPGDQAGANNYFNYQNWSGNIIQKAFQYATGKGQRPAPWGTGDVTKQDQLQSIGLQKNIQGSDILNLIIGLDDNASGAIRDAVHLILNLRNNGFTSAMNIIGSGSFNSVLSQYSNQFGSTTQNDLINLLQHLLIHIRDIQNLNTGNFVTVVTNGGNLLIDIIALLSNIVFNVSTDTIKAMQAINDTIIISFPNAPNSFYIDLFNQFILLFNSAVSEAYTSIINQLNVIAANLNNDINSFIVMFGGTVTFISFANSLLQVAEYLGIPKTAVLLVGNGIIGLALGGGLPQILPSSQPTNPTNSSLSTAANLLIGLLGMFRGNNIATQEVLSGSLIKQFLSNNPLKYRREDRNDGQSVLKRFPD